MGVSKAPGGSVPWQWLSQQSSVGCPLPLTLPMVSSLAKLWVHQILVLLLPFLGLSAVAEGCEREEGAGARPSPGKGGCRVG